uniref:Uncharacterized protein n=1 Tax=Rhizophora mucronata TaxID=61149 RepID=A0A2P2QNE9_RHIMU
MVFHNFGCVFSCGVLIPVRYCPSFHYLPMMLLLDIGLHRNLSVIQSLMMKTTLMI